MVQFMSLQNKNFKIMGQFRDLVNK